MNRAIFRPYQQKSGRQLTLLSRCRAAFLYAAFLCGIPTAGYCDTFAAIPNLDLVMAGQSSTGNDQVWMRVQGQPSGIPADCVYGTWSLFYADGTSGISREQALSLLLTAKSSGKPVTIGFVIGSQSDFFGFGYSKCRLTKVAM